MLQLTPARIATTLQTCGLMPENPTIGDKGITSYENLAHVFDTHYDVSVTHSIVDNDELVACILNALPWGITQTELSKVLGLCNNMCTNDAVQYDHVFIRNLDEDKIIAILLNKIRYEDEYDIIIAICHNAFSEELTSFVNEITKDIPELFSDLDEEDPRANRFSHTAVEQPVEHTHSTAVDFANFNDFFTAAFDAMEEPISDALSKAVAALPLHLQTAYTEYREVLLKTVSAFMPVQSLNAAKDIADKQTKKHTVDSLCELWIKMNTSSNLTPDESDTAVTAKQEQSPAFNARADYYPETRQMIMFLASDNFEYLWLKAETNQTYHVLTKVAIYNGNANALPAFILDGISIFTNSTLRAKATLNRVIYEVEIYKSSPKLVLNFAPSSIQTPQFNSVVSFLDITGVQESASHALLVDWCKHNPILTPSIFVSLEVLKGLCHGCARDALKLETEAGQELTIYVHYAADCSTTVANYSLKGSLSWVEKASGREVTEQINIHGISSDALKQLWLNNLNLTQDRLTLVKFDDVSYVNITPPVYTNGDPDTLSKDQNFHASVLKATLMNNLSSYIEHNKILGEFNDILDGNCVIPVTQSVAIVNAEVKEFIWRRKFKNRNYSTILGCASIDDFTKVSLIPANYGFINSDGYKCIEDTKDSVSSFLRVPPVNSDSKFITLSYHGVPCVACKVDDLVYYAVTIPKALTN